MLFVPLKHIQTASLQHMGISAREYGHLTSFFSLC